MNIENTSVMRFAFVGLLLSSLVALPGCFGGSGALEPSSPDPELVKAGVVHTPSPIFRNGKDLITIKTVDGKAPVFLDNKTLISPGEHVFQISLELYHDGDASTKSFVTRADTSLKFNVEAEHEYLIDAVEDENGLWLWVTDTTDNAIVAGEAPRELPAAERTRPQWKK